MTDPGAPTFLQNRLAQVGAERDRLAEDKARVEWAHGQTCIEKKEALDERDRLAARVAELERDLAVANETLAEENREAEKVGKELAQYERDFWREHDRLQRATEALRVLVNGDCPDYIRPSDTDAYLDARTKANALLAALAGEDEKTVPPQREGDYL